MGGIGFWYSELMTHKYRILLGLFVVGLVTSMASPGSGTPLARQWSEAVVRPGAKIIFLDDASCTMNFVFKGSDRRKYVGTAGHCPLSNVQDAVVWKRGQGIPAQDASGTSIGKFVFAAYSEGKPHYDFALVRLNRNVRPDPQMEYFGGPTRMNDTLTTTNPELINIYGQGRVLGDTSPQRQVLAPNGFDDRKVLFTTGVVTPGDSGSPATSDDDEALGIVTAAGVYARIPENGPPYPGITRIIRLPFNLDFAEQQLGIRLKLLTAPPL